MELWTAVKFDNLENVFFNSTVYLKPILHMYPVNKSDPVYPYLTPGPRGDGCLPRCGTEPSQHCQVPEQPQNYGPRHQAECEIWSSTTAIDGKRTKAERRVDTW